jgi:hypothetical protein
MFDIQNSLFEDSIEYKFFFEDNSKLVYELKLDFDNKIFDGLQDNLLFFDEVLDPIFFCVLSLF